jgi:hypothetical protein
MYQVILSNRELVKCDGSQPAVGSHSTKNEPKRSNTDDDWRIRAVDNPLLKKCEVSRFSSSSRSFQRKTKRKPSATSDSADGSHDEAPDDSDLDPDFVLSSGDSNDESAGSRCDEGDSDAEIPLTLGRQLSSNSVTRTTIGIREKDVKQICIDSEREVSSSADYAPKDETQSGKNNDEHSDCEKCDSGQQTLKVTVARSVKESFSKRPYCYYCAVQQLQVQRHWLSKHGSEKYVIEIDKCKDLVERRRLIARLRNLGNHCHNVDVLSKGSGEIMVTHRKAIDAEANNYVPCDSCFSYVLKRELRRHKCKLGKRQKGRVVLEAQLMLPAPNGLTAQVYELICSMKDDDVRFLAKSDKLIMDYAKS